MAALKYWLWLAELKGVSCQQKLALLEHFQEPDAIYYGQQGEYLLVEGMTRKAAEALEEKSLERADSILGDCDRLGLRCITIRDTEYPDRLRNIYEPPLLLYVKGRMPRFDEEVAIAMVGSRRASPYALQMGEKLAYQLTKQGAIVVSGLAGGGDAAAHRGALRAGGFTAAVIGGGHDVIFPRENHYLYEDIAVQGVILSEYPPGTQHLGAHFPVRNRIISGLSDGVLAVEGRESGGTMITMDLALEQNRDTFAVPGPADAPMSAGTNRLIRMGWAKLVTSADDILAEYQGRRPLRRTPPAEPELQEERLRTALKPERPVPVCAEPSDKKEVDKTVNRAYIDWKSARELFTDDERDILLALAQKDMSADEIVEQTQIPARRVLSALTILQMRGYVEERAGRRFAALAILRMDNENDPK